MADRDDGDRLALTERLARELCVEVGRPYPDALFWFRGEELRGLLRARLRRALPGTTAQERGRLILEAVA